MKKIIKRYGLQLATIITLILVVFFVFYLMLYKREPRTHETPFNKLPGWGTQDARMSLKAFLVSCEFFLHQKPDHFVGNSHFNLKAKDFFPACKAAMALRYPGSEDAKLFFEQYFMPYEFNNGFNMKGLFTGYYLPQILGSLNKTLSYQVPIYGVPKNKLDANLPEFGKTMPESRIVGRVKKRNFVPYYTRRQINHGAIDKLAPIFAWVETEVDRLILEIEGSGSVKLTNGDELYLHYDGTNGKQYTSIPGLFIRKGILTKNSANMDNIKSYVKKHPDIANDIFNQNESFVFFTKLDQKVAKGSQGLILTPGYSMAVDKRWVPLGTPLWLDTKAAKAPNEAPSTFQRLMIAQDVGGAIKGPVRGDIYWGSGEEATKIADSTHSKGRYWLLLPKKGKINNPDSLE